MSKPVVAVLCGGLTAERNISLESGEIVFQHIDRTLYTPVKIRVDADGWREETSGNRVDLNTFSFEYQGRQVKPRQVFMAIHGSPGEDGKLQGYLDLMQVPYTCCNNVVAAVTFNKAFCKQVLQGRVAMAKGRVLMSGDEAGIAAVRNDFQLPLFVKPNNNGSSYGISKITDWSQLEAALQEGFTYDTEILVEEGIQGREVTCGVYQYRGEVVVLPLCEVVTGKHDFFNYTAKYTAGESHEIIPAPIPEAEADRIRQHSADIYRFLGCSGVVRIDYIIHQGTPHFLEVNTVPGMSAASIVPQMAKAAGLTLADFFTRLLTESL